MPDRLIRRVSFTPGDRAALDPLSAEIGIRAITLRYQPSVDRLIGVLGAGRPLRSADIARLGDR